MKSQPSSWPRCSAICLLTQNYATDLWRQTQNGTGASPHSWPSFSGLWRRVGYPRWGGWRRVCGWLWGWSWGLRWAFLCGRMIVKSRTRRVGDALVLEEWYYRVYCLLIDDDILQTSEYSMHLSQTLYTPWIREQTELSTQPCMLLYFIEHQYLLYVHSLIPSLSIQRNKSVLLWYLQ